MRFLLVSIFVISLMGILLIPNAFGTTQIVIIPVGASSGDHFDPSIIEIKKDDMVKWANLDRNTAHTVTSTSTNWTVDSGDLLPNNDQNYCYPYCKPTFSYTFDAGGTYDYGCKIHSWMKGVVKVIELGQDAEIKIHGYAGDMYIDKSQYEVIEDGSVKIKIYGEVKNPGLSAYILFTITKPDGSTSELKTYRTGEGYYQLILSINYEDRGTYNVVSTYGLENIGTANFVVVERSIPENLFPPFRQYDGSGNLVESSSTLTIGTDFPSYKKGDMIQISGITPYLGLDVYGKSPVLIDLTLQILNPQNNIVTVSQMRPNNDGIYFTTISSEGPLFRTEGDYTIKAKYGVWEASTKFFLTVPNTFNPQSPAPSTQSKTSTLLILNPLSSTFEAQGQNSQAEVIVSGKLTSSDRQYVITSAIIQLKAERWGTTITTDGNGEFSFKKNWDVGNDYGVYAVFDGTSNFEPSKSQTEYFDVRPGAFQPQTTAPTEDSSPAGGVALLVIIMIVVIVAIAIKKRKKKIPVTIPPPSGGGIAGTATIAKAFISRKIPRAGKAPLLMGKIRQAKSAVGRQSPKAKYKTDHMRYLRCDNCGNEDLVNGSNGEQSCPQCGWKKL